MDNNSLIWCVSSSKVAGEKMIGTAVESTRWMLVEYDQPWTAKALQGSDLPEHVKTYLDNLPDTRVQFIRQPNNPRSDIRVFVGDATDSQPRLYATTISTYEELLSIDIEAIFKDNTDIPQYNEPLFLVCCNGKRDLCCAKFGLELYTELDAKLGNKVWQTTHLGGHRFAPTALILPDGLAYGWADNQAEKLINSYDRREILLDLYRGRVSYPRPAQAAESFLRPETGNLKTDAYQLITVETASKDNWLVVFRESLTRREHVIRVRMVMSDFKVYKSTGDEEPAHVPQFEQI